MNESHCCINADSQKEDSKPDARIAGETLRAFADRDSPINQEQPDSVRQMPNCRGDAGQIDNKDPWPHKLVMNDRKTLLCVRGH